MAVDEQIARAWGKLNRHEGAAGKVRLNGGTWEVFGPRYRPFQDAWEAVPDPATQPWEYIEAFNRAGWSVLVKPSGIELRSPEGEWTSHRSLEAAIRAWEASHAQ